ncbi:hypothetical protein, partial [Dolosicoccus paucivorans]
MTKDLFKKVVLGAAIATPLTAGMMAVSAEELPVDADEEITSLDVVTEVDAVSADEVDASKEDGVLEDETVVEEAVLANEVLGEREPATDDGVLAGPYYSDEVSVYEYVKELRKTENQKDVFYEIIEDENDSNKHYIKRHKVDLNEVNGPFDTIDDAYYEGRELWQTLAYASANTHNLVYDIIEKGGKYYTQLVVPEFEVIESNTSYVESLQEMLEELASGDKYNAYTEVRDEDGEVVGYVLKSVQSNLNDNNYEVSYDEDKVVVEDFSILKPSVVLVKNPLLTDDEQVTVKESKYGYTTGSYLFYKYQDGSTDTSYKNRGRWEDSVLEIIHVSPDFVLEDGLFGDREVKWYNPDIPVREQGLVPEYSYESSFEGENPKYSLDMFKPEYALDFLDKEESKPEQDKEDELSQPTKDQVSDTITGEKPNKGQVSDTITGEKP